MVAASEDQDDDAEAEDVDVGKEGDKEDDAGDEDDDEEETDDMVVDVMLGEPGGSTFNTLVLGGTDVVIPLERDAHADPFQDDEVWLRSPDGSFERRLCSNDDAVEEDEDSGLLLYHFTRVPFGVYSVFVVSAGVEVETLRGLVVRREGVFLGEKQLSDSRDGKPMAPPPTGEDDEDELGDPDLESPPDDELEEPALESSADDEDVFIDQEDNDEGDGDGDGGEDQAEADKSDEDSDGDGGEEDKEDSDDAEA
jgi:hypothetical protein